MFQPKEMLTKPVNKTLKDGNIFCALSATVGTALVCSIKRQIVAQYTSQDVLANLT